MNDPDSNPPNTDKFFDIIPSSKRSVSPTSRPIIVDNSPSQTDRMINEEPIIPNQEEVVEKSPIPEVDEPIVSQEPEIKVATEKDLDSPEEQIEESVSEDIPTVTTESDNHNTTVDQPEVHSEEELLLPEHATQDDLPQIAAVVTESKLKKSFWKNPWVITIIIVLILLVVSGIVYEYVYKSLSSSTSSQNSIY